MQITETSFNANRHHIHLELIVVNPNGVEYSVDAILDTGAPRTEFSDHFLIFTGFIESTDRKIEIESGLQTRKINKISVPYINICGHVVNDFEVYVSQFEESWGIDALIGLDFFRKFLVEIDYSRGVLITKPFERV